jgi:hypothetical protein
VISGSNFGATRDTLTFGGVNIQVSDGNWNSQMITADLPNEIAAGMVTVTVTVNGTASNVPSFNLTPSIGTVSPASAAAVPSVTITGANFGAVQGDSLVTFGGTGAPKAASWTPTTITVPIPSGLKSGLVAPIVVTVNGAQSNSVDFKVQ